MAAGKGVGVCAVGIETLADEECWVGGGGGGGVSGRLKYEDADAYADLWCSCCHG